MARTDAGLAFLGRPLLVLLVSILLMHLSLYIVLPLLPVILLTTQGLNPAEVGLEFGAGAIAFQVAP